MKIKADYIGIPGPNESFSWRAETNPKELFVKSLMGKILVKPWIYRDEKTFKFKAYKSIEAFLKDWTNITTI